MRKSLLFSLFLVLTWVSLAQAQKDPPFLLPSAQELSHLKSASLLTSKGRIVFELFPDTAPQHVANFKYLADSGYFKGKEFHLFREGYIIQAGATVKNPNASPGWSLAPEFSDREHLRGSLGMARIPDQFNTERRSSGGQFHILLSDASHMNGSYTVFGRVLSGMDVVDRLRAGDEIKELKVYVSK